MTRTPRQSVSEKLEDSPTTMLYTLIRITSQIFPPSLSSSHGTWLVSRSGGCSNSSGSFPHFLSQVLSLINILHICCLFLRRLGVTHLKIWKKHIVGPNSTPFESETLMMAPRNLCFNLSDNSHAYQSFWITAEVYSKKFEFYSKLLHDFEQPRPT